MSWLKKKTIVVPIDFSDRSIQAVHLARTLVAEPSGLHVVHVFPIHLVGEPGLPLRERVPQQLQEVLPEPEFADVVRTVLWGDAGSEIARYAEEAGAELIVLPSHGRSGLSHLLIGSVAERVLRLAPCPVLVLRNADLWTKDLPTP